jgi:hypothetical protein
MPKATANRTAIAGKVSMRALIASGIWGNTASGLGGTGCAGVSFLVLVNRDAASAAACASGQVPRLFNAASAAQEHISLVFRASTSRVVSGGTLR